MADQTTMEDTASQNLIELRALYSGIDETSSILQSIATPPDLDLDVRVYQDHIQIVLQFCGHMIERLRTFRSSRPDLLDAIELWERGALPNEVVEAVERSSGMRSTEFKEAKFIFRSILHIKRETLNLLKAYQWKYTVILILLEWKRALP